MGEDAAALTRRPSITVIGDLVEGWPPHGLGPDDLDRLARDALLRRTEDQFGPQGDEAVDRDGLAVVGGYLERLPLACLKAGLVDLAADHERLPGVYPLTRCEHRKG